MTNVSAHAMTATALAKNAMKKRVAGSSFLTGPSPNQSLTVGSWVRLANGSNYCKVDLTLKPRAPYGSCSVMAYLSVNHYATNAGGNKFVRGGIEVAGPNSYSSTTEVWHQDRNTGDLIYGAGMIPLALSGEGAYSFYVVVYSYTSIATFGVELPGSSGQVGIHTQTFASTTPAAITSYRQTVTLASRGGANAQPVLHSVGISFYTGVSNGIVYVTSRVVRASDSVVIYDWTALGWHWFNYAQHRCIYGARTYSSLIVANETYHFDVGAYVNQATADAGGVNHDSNDWAAIAVVEL